MQQRLSLITLGVADLMRSIRFYERLGWRRSVRNAEGVAFFQLPGMALGLYPREELAKDANVPADGGGFRGISLAYNPRTRDEVDAVLSEAASAGGTITKHPSFRIEFSEARSSAVIEFLKRKSLRYQLGGLENRARNSSKLYHGA